MNNNTAELNNNNVNATDLDTATEVYTPVSRITVRNTATVVAVLGALAIIGFYGYKFYKSSCAVATVVADEPTADVSSAPVEETPVV